MKKANDVLVLPGFELVLNEQHATRGVARDHLSATSVVTPLAGVWSFRGRATSRYESHVHELHAEQIT